MFFMNMPANFDIGDTTDCRVSGEDTWVTWRDRDTIVIGGNDVRKIVETKVDASGLRCFICGEQNVTLDARRKSHRPR